MNLFYTLFLHPDWRIETQCKKNHFLALIIS